MSSPISHLADRGPAIRKTEHGRVFATLGKVAAMVHSFAQHRGVVIATALTLAIVTTLGFCQDQPRGKKGGGKGGSGLGGYEKPPPVNDVPAQPFNIILGRPTDTSITIRVLTSAEGQGFVTYRAEGASEGKSTKGVKFTVDQPRDIVLEGLQPDTRYTYHWHWQPTGSMTPEQSDGFTFHTQRARGNSFTFTVTADSHLDENTSGPVYLRTLANALADQPDFHFELGDTFMTGKYVRPEYALGQYRAQRYFLGHLCHSAPLFFVLGNHDGESGGRGSMTWASQTRKLYFPNPSPTAFYPGNQQKEPEIGFPEDYYAWNWGDAQFIVLDPFRYTTRRPRGNKGGTSNSANDDSDSWSWTLGTEQYQWLKRVLAQNSPKYRFVFLHHLIGGAPQNQRGGAEVAGLWEWGGKNRDGQYEFDRQRPGWGQPIHQLLKQHGVSVVFHGHDHLFVKQDYDGIVYQEVPQPGHARIGNTRTAEEYGYLSGEIQASSGHVRVRVDDQAVRVDYVRTYLPQDETAMRMNGDVSYSYQVQPSSSGKTASTRRR